MADGNKTRDEEVLKEQERRAEEVKVAQSNMSPDDQALKASQDRLYEIHDDADRRAKDMIAVLEKNGQALTDTQKAKLRDDIATHYSELDGVHNTSNSRKLRSKKTR